MRPECGRGPPGHFVTDATRALTPFRRGLHPLDAASVDSNCGPALHGADGLMPGSPEVYRPTALRAVAYVFPRRIEGAASNSCRLRAYANSAGAPPVWMNTTASSGVKRPSRTSAT